MQRSDWMMRSIVAVSVLGMLLFAVSAHAATRSMTGALGVINPSTATPFLFEGGPGVFGKKIGAYPPTDGFKTVEVAGATAGTFVGRQLTVGQSQFNFNGQQLRDFPAFANVANLTKTFMSVQNAATFMEGAGALAACPGPGCTSSGSGTAISWCPPLATPPGSPAPGTAAGQIGDWDCTSWVDGFVGGNRFLRIGITNSSARNNFGGTFELLRNTIETVWRVAEQPGTDGIAVVSRSWMDQNNFAWTGGLENFAYTTLAGNAGPVVFGQLNTRGAVTQTTGCTNPGGTVGVGKTFVIGVPISGVGSNCGTATGGDPPGQGWGFKMTTGTIEGSDPYPYLQGTTALGTPFAPLFGPNTKGPNTGGFFFTRMGTDTVSGTNRNIVMLGGGVSVDPDSGNAFFRITDFRLNLQVPEPAMGLGLIAGAAALAGLARRRRQS